jgi:hypothetical protein
MCDKWSCIHSFDPVTSAHFTQYPLHQNYKFRHEIFSPLTPQITATMPQFHLIVRTESEEKVLPPHKITDITITGLPADIEFDKNKIFDIYTVIDQQQLWVKTA